MVDHGNDGQVRRRRSSEVSDASRMR
jgi:hypothetical protein